MHTTTTTTGFLTSMAGNIASTTPIKLYVTAETDAVAAFDQRTLSQWRNEGFDVSYLPFATSDSDAQYKSKLKGIVQASGVGERVGIVAFGAAASLVLDFARRPGSARLGCVVAYYPDVVPDTRLPFPPYMQVLVHFAGDQVGVKRRREVLGIQGKEQVTQKRIPSGTGVGGLVEGIKWRAYSYGDVEAGFAESDLDEYDAVAERLAWSRSLECVKRAFGVLDDDVESNWEEACRAKYTTGDADNLLATLTTNASINYTPVMLGGMGPKQLARFYSDFFLPDTPPSLTLKLLSRTLGADQIVDELLLAFDHTQECTWILPGVPPTKKHVEVVMVVIARVRGGRVQHESHYWDQASVLVQVGLLDPSLQSPAMKKAGVERLPVIGAEAARKVRDFKSEPSNELLDDW